MKILSFLLLFLPALLLAQPDTIVRSANTQNVVIYPATMPPPALAPELTAWPSNIPITPGELFWVENDTLCTLAGRKFYSGGIWQTMAPPTFLIVPVWLESDDNPRDSILFFLTDAGTVGFYEPKIHQLRSQRAIRLIRGRTELSCVSATVYTIDIAPDKRMIYLQTDDGKTNVLRVFIVTDETQVGLYVKN